MRCSDHSLLRPGGIPKGGGIGSPGGGIPGGGRRGGGIIPGIIPGGGSRGGGIPGTNAPGGGIPGLLCCGSFSGVAVVVFVVVLQ